MSTNPQKKPVTWCAIGDSFTYLDSHLEETGHRLRKGYLTRTLELLPDGVELLNLGINGSATTDWLTKEIPSADFYTILLGTNDWFSRHTLPGTESDFKDGVSGTILGNLRLLIESIRKAAPEAPVFVMNPVERGEFVYLFDHENHAHGSDRPENGVWLKDVAELIFTHVRGRNIYPIDLHTRSGFTPENAVRFKRIRNHGVTEYFTYEEYRDFPEFKPETDIYPYPEEAIWMTYDGLHPSDEGAEIIAKILSEEIKTEYFSKAVSV